MQFEDKSGDFFEDQTVENVVAYGDKGWLLALANSGILLLPRSDVDPDARDVVPCAGDSLRIYRLPARAEKIRGIDLNGRQLYYKSLVDLSERPNDEKPLASMIEGLRVRVTYVLAQPVDTSLGSTDAGFQIALVLCAKHGWTLATVSRGDARRAVRALRAAPANLQDPRIRRLRGALSDGSFISAGEMAILFLTATTR
jgi:hypothetical protein